MNPDDDLGGLKPPQFRLRTLLYAIGLLGILFALVPVIGGYAVVWLIVFVLAIAAHVAGNAIGTALRDSATRALASSAPPPHYVPHDTDFATPTQLRERGRLGLTVLVITIVGTLTSAAGGGYYLIRQNWDAATPASVTTAVIVCGVLGGIASFLAGSFITVTVAAIVQAARDPQS